jgi:hypothetical protein
MTGAAPRDMHYEAQIFTKGTSLLACAGEWAEEEPIQQFGASAAEPIEAHEGFDASRVLVTPHSAAP